MFPYKKEKLKDLVLTKRVRCSVNANNELPGSLRLVKLPKVAFQVSSSSTSFSPVVPILFRAALRAP